jgi:hypothetical protein
MPAPRISMGIIPLYLTDARADTLMGILTMLLRHTEGLSGIPSKSRISPSNDLQQCYSLFPADVQHSKAFTWTVHVGTETVATADASA